MKKIIAVIVGAGLIALGGIIAPRLNTKADPQTNTSYSCPEGTTMRIDVVSGATCEPNPVTADPTPVINQTIPEPPITTYTVTPSCH